MDRFLRIAVTLTALDRMSSVVRGATTESIRRMRELEERTRQAQASIGAGAAQIAAGVGIAMAMRPALDAFMELEDAGARMKSSLLEAGNYLPQESFDRLSKLAVKLGDDLPGTTADFFDMFTTMRQLGVETETILSGAGESAAHLAVVLKLPFEQTSMIVAKLKEATGTSDKELNGFIDTIARVANMGVKTDEMMLAFGRSAPALKILGIQGAEASKSMAALYAMMIKGGMSGETVGTNMMAMLNQLLNSNKVDAMNKSLEKLNIAPMSFMDAKSGTFLGVENMIAQFSKLGTLNPQQISDIVEKGFGPGMDAGIVKIMAAAGIKGFNEMNAGINKQAMLGDKVKTMLNTLSAQWEATTGAWGNTMATAFAPLGGILTGIVVKLGNVASAIGRFAESNPRLFELIGILVSMASVALMVSGAIKVVRGAMLLLNGAMLLNPWVLAIAAIIAAVSAIYVYWGPIKSFFAGLWNGIKNIFSGFLNFLANVFFAFTPLGFIIANWGPILSTFQNIFGKVWTYLTTVFDRFKQAGANIVGSIADGIMAGIGKVTDAIGRVTKAAREYLPFSPAKQGAFRDLHKVKIIETIAGSMNARPLTSAMGRATAQAAGVARPVSGSGGGGFNYSPTITITGGGEGAVNDFRKELAKHKDDIIRIFSQEQSRKQRLSF